MFREEVLSQLKEAEFFQTLSESSKAAVLAKWSQLDDETIGKIYLLCGQESVVSKLLFEAGQEMLPRYCRKVSFEMVEDLEALSSSEDEEYLEDLMHANGI